ncbi:MAG: glycosyltransferase family 2 protein [Gemmatimonadota bacterium]|nr:glycosyltransferase family 2 protein [Gemmatimonadota bacterium]
MTVPAATQQPRVSVLVPAKDEAENLPEFMKQAAVAFASEPGRYEVVVIDDGSTDGTPALLESLRAQYPFLHSVRHRSRRGIADALRTGYMHSRGDVLVFYPADLQFRPADIPKLVDPIIAGEFDMMTGRKDGDYERAFVSGIYNSLSRRLFDVPVRDLNSVKAYRREVMAALPVRPDWHRYMIVVAAHSGFTVGETPIPVYPRAAGKSKFGISRIPVGVLDMLAVWFELRFARKPLLLFGMLGAFLFLVGVATGLVAVLYRIIAGVGFRPLLTLVEVCLILGSVFFATGLLAELMAAQRAEIAELRRRVEDVLVRETDPHR